MFKNIKNFKKQEGVYTVEKQTKTDLGSIKVHADVINSIASIAATNVEGVARIYKGPVGKFLQFLGADLDQSGIKVVFKEGNEVDIGVTIVVEYGYEIPKVANLVQESIKEAVEGTTGLVAGDIDVEVHGVEASSPRITESPRV